MTSPFFKGWSIEYLIKMIGLIYTSFFGTGNFKYMVIAVKDDYQEPTGPAASILTNIEDRGTFNKFICKIDSVIDRTNKKGPGYTDFRQASL